MADHVIKITASGYDPTPLPVKRSDTVWWLNTNSGVHSAVADDGSFETPELRRGEAAPVIINSGAGWVGYHDRTTKLTGMLEVTV